MTQFCYAFKKRNKKLSDVDDSAVKIWTELLTGTDEEVSKISEEKFKIK